jgi:hypothetical protein
MDNIKGTLIRSDKAHYPGGDFFSIKIDQQTKETLKLVFIKLLNQLTNAVQAEQLFCQEFFRTAKSEENTSLVGSVSANSTSNNSHTNNNQLHTNQLSRYPSEASITSTSTNNSKQLANDHKNDA